MPSFLRTVICIIVLCLPYQETFAQHWQWAKSAGGSTLSDIGFGITADADGNSYVTGYFEETATFGNITLTSAGDKDIFLAKYDSTGKPVWAKRAGGADYDSGYRVALDAKSNIYITGRIDGKGFFGERSDIFLSKYTPDGNLIWTRRAGGPGMDFGSDIAVDGTGKIYVTGWYTGSITFDDISLAGNNGGNLFVARYDAEGKVIWAIKSGGTNSVLTNGLALDASGQVYVTGSFKGPDSFGTITLNSLGSMEDAFIAKYNPEGKVIWAKSAGGVGWDFSDDIAVDGSGNSYITGAFYDYNASFGSFILTNGGNSDVFIAKYDSDGNVLWAKSAGGSNFDTGAAIAIDGDGNSFITGSFLGVATFGATTLKGDLSDNMFVTQYSPAGEVVWAKQAGDYGRGIAVTVKGTGYVTGEFSFTTAFDNFKLSSTIPSNDIFIAKFGPRPAPDTTTVEPPEDVFIPNIITPNGDGLNDTFAPRIPGRVMGLKIFNRWGNLIYEKLDYRNQWNGENLSDSTYYYLLTSATGQNWKGWVEIFR